MLHNILILFIFYLTLFKFEHTFMQNNLHSTIQGTKTWASNLHADELSFVKHFVLASGSLKALAEQYGVSYPTLRTRLDKLIQRIRQFDSDAPDAFRQSLRNLVAEGSLEPEVARQLLAVHQSSIEQATATAQNSPTTSGNKLLVEG